MTLNYQYHIILLIDFFNGVKKMIRKLMGFIAFVSVGMGLIASTTINNNKNPLIIGFLVIVFCFITISLVDQYKDLKN